MSLGRRRLRRAAESLAAAFAGGAIGAAAGAAAGPPGALAAAGVAAANGLVSGWRGVYDWRSGRGWLAFALDSSWGLPGTLLAVCVHVANAARPSRYRDDLSARRNRHVYECGVRLKGRFAFTLGNAISNAGCGRGRVDEAFIRNHEELHVWQARWFGPLFQTTYVAWAVLGAVAAAAVWAVRRDGSLASLVETGAYYDNPFEYWAYRNDGKWPPPLAHPRLAWGKGGRGEDRA